VDVVTDSGKMDSGKMDLEPGREERGLVGEAGEGRVIPDKMVGAADFFLKAPLGTSDLVSHRQRQAAKHR
ncbi:MAG: hypothetical protein DVB28_002007, partial [Verrucomicrobia bacterium]